LRFINAGCAVTVPSLLVEHEVRRLKIDCEGVKLTPSGLSEALGSKIIASHEYLHIETGDA
jgi:hypothetical protein